MSSREPRPQEGVDFTVITVKARSFDDGDRQFKAKPSLYFRDGWEIYTMDEEYIGLVEKYQGSIDRVHGRIRYPGKRRALWSAKHKDATHSMHQLESRAAAIRWMTQGHVL